MRILLHTCCGPCFLGVWDDLGTKDLEITNYFYNSNIYPEEEYVKRLENLRIAIEGKTAGLIEDEYLPEQHASAVEGYENDFPARCEYCYRLRLEKTAEYAARHGFDAFSTTLLVSPYQQHEMIRNISEELATKYGVKFYYTDWRPHYRAGQDTARIIPIYRQKYCGCKYSLRERGIK